MERRGLLTHAQVDHRPGLGHVLGGPVGVEGRGQSGGDSPADHGAEDGRCRQKLQGEAEVNVTDSAETYSFRPNVYPLGLNERKVKPSSATQ